MDNQLHTIKLLISESQIQEKIVELGKQISADYKDKKNITLIYLAQGGIIFAADLSRKITLDIEMEQLEIISGYHNQTQREEKPSTSPWAKVVEKIRQITPNRHILVVDDILDTGLTLQYTLELIQKQSTPPLSLKTCVLLDKPERRQAPIKADYIGFTIPNHFVVGFGMDYHNHYRNLSYIGILEFS